VAEPATTDKTDTAISAGWVLEHLLSTAAPA